MCDQSFIVHKQLFIRHLLFTDLSDRDGANAIPIALPMTMMLCSVSICLLAAPDIFLCIMWKKTKRSGEEEEEGEEEEVKDMAGQEPVYDKLQ